LVNLILLKKTEQNYARNPSERKTPAVQVGHVFMGSGHPIAIQSMTNTPTADIPATVEQIKELANAGSELVRITINDDAAMAAVPKLFPCCAKNGYTTPIIGDFHYNGHILLNKYPEARNFSTNTASIPAMWAKAKPAMNNFSQIIKIAVKYDKPIRIGVNWGSLDKELLGRLMDKNAKSKSPKDSKEIVRDAMIQSALESARQAIKLDLKNQRLS